MSHPIAFGVSESRVSLVADSVYYEVFLSMARRAKFRLWCSVFIVDLTPVDRTKFPADEFLHVMAEATWRGADTRLLVGGSRDNIALAEAAESARARALKLGVRCRWLTSSNVRGSHVKLVIADDQVLTGSHNWSPGALHGHGQVQDSVLIESRNLALGLGSRFEFQWERGKVYNAAL
jgi:phosphatidylserine/phosphatidylglycerophosphate/cardiolipin synthase-like enzyme